MLEKAVSNKRLGHKDTLVADRAATERLPNALPEFFVVAPAHALVALRERAGLDLRCERAGGHDTLTVGEVENAPGKHLDLALSIARLRILVRVSCRTM